LVIRTLDPDPDTCQMTTETKHWPQGSEMSKEVRGGAAAWVEGRGGELQPLQDSEWRELAHPVVGHRQLVLPPLLLITQGFWIWIRIRIYLRCWIWIQVYKF
jgi:hypothetical protein